MRWALGIEYDGRAFHGWERQRHARTVQACVEDALSRVADAPVRTVCAGRTDAGVHARGQVAHFDAPVERPVQAWTLGVNTHLPEDAAVRWACRVPNEFHARFAATRREYLYRIHCSRLRAPLLRGRVAWVHRRLDAGAMQEAGRILLGEHDFTSFRGSGCQARSPVREIHELRVSGAGDMLSIRVSANAFLMHMVRNIAGTLIAVGGGERPASWVGEVLAGRDRRLAGPTAPPDGLCLETVRYPARFELPAVSGEGPVC